MATKGFGIKYMLMGFLGVDKRHHDDDNDMDNGTVMTVSSTANVRGMPNKLMTSTKDTEQLNEIIEEGVLRYGLPALGISIAATFAMRRLFLPMKSTLPEKFVLGTLTYFGAAWIGLLVGMSLYEPTFNSKVLEKMPHSDLARAIRAEQSNRS